MLRCSELVHLYASDALGHASLSKRVAVRLHLMMCRRCSRYVRELDAIADAARGRAEAEGDQERVEALVRRVMDTSDGK